MKYDITTTKTCKLEEMKKKEQHGERRRIECNKRGHDNCRGGRGRSGMVSFEMWHVINKDSPTGGEEREERVVELRNVAGYKRGINDLRGWKGKRKIVNF